MKKGSLLVSFLICLLLLPTVCEGATKWRTLKTEHFTLFYPAELADEAWEVLQTLEYYRPRIEQLTGNRRQHLPVVLNDHGVTANGMANPVYNQIHLYWYPPRAGSIGTVEDWYTLVAIHEYTHILQMTNVGGGAKVLCSVVGDILSPNLWVPDWIIEGIAVYTESQLSSFQGRLNDGLYDAYIGARVADGRFPKILDATFSPHEFQLDGIYTYGGLFLEYLAQTYGEEKLTEFFNRRGSSILASFDAHAKTVFGKSFPQLWEDWKAYETKRFKDFAIDGVPVTTKGWYTAHPTLAAGEEGERMLFYQRLIPVKTGTGSSFYRREIIARNLDTGVEKVVLSSTASLNLPIKIWNNDKLYYGVEEIKPGYDNVIDFSYGMISQIREKDLRTGKDRLVLAGEIRAYDLLPDGRILYACATRNRFGSQLYLYQGEEGSKFLYEVPYLIDEIAAGDERIILSAREKRTGNDLYLFTLATGELKPLVTSAHAEYGITLAGEHLFFQANYGQEYAVYCYDFRTEQISKMTTGGYAAQPAYDPDRDELYFIGLNSHGFDIYRKKATFEEFVPPDYSPATPLAGMAYKVEGLDIKEGSYRDNLATLTPKIFIPFYIYPGIGFYTSGSDAISHFPSYSLILTHDFQDNEWWVDFSLDLTVLPPLMTSLGYSSSELRPLWFNLSYPLLYRLSPGLSKINIGSMLRYGREWGTELIPYVFLGFKYPTTTLDLYFQTPVEDLSYDEPGAKRIGYYGGLNVNQLILNGNLRLQLEGCYDPDSPLRTVFPLLRGYRWPLRATTGGVFTLEYSRPLYQLRTGSWPLKLYFEDLCSSLFVDGAVSDQGEYQLSWGVEFYQELKFLFAGVALNLNPGIGFSFNREGERFIFFTLKVPQNIMKGAVR